MYAVKMKTTELFTGTLTECVLWLADSLGNQTMRFLVEAGYSIEKAAP